ncbi:hypothetical protein [Azospirillum endophyticum]
MTMTLRTVSADATAGLPAVAVPGAVVRDPLGAGRRRARNGLLAGLGGVAAAAALAWVLRPGPSRRGATAKGTAAEDATLQAGRRLNRAAALLGASVLADSAVEHYRGSFHNPAMITPLLASAATIAVSLHGSLDGRPRAHRLRDATYAAAALTGLVGTAFHLFNVTRRPGGLSWLNLFYGAPIGAPAAIALAGILGFAAERVRHNAPDGPPSVAGLPAPEVLTVLAAAGILGTVAETALLHFRGAYHNPAMYLPVTVPPAAAAILLRTLWRGGQGPRTAARWAMRATAGLGLLGTGFHAFGVHRNMGGWGNWRQNILNGPPLPAPPSYTALAFAGLAALTLQEEVAVGGGGREEGDGR